MQAYSICFPLPSSLKGMKIRHTGVVTSVEKGRISVSIDQHPACASCQAASRCAASKSEKKVVDVSCPATPGSYAVGDEVVVAMEAHTGLISVAIAFLAPFALVLLSILISSSLGAEDPTAALIGLGSLFPYYGALYLLRSKIGKRVAFEIEER